MSWRWKHYPAKSTNQPASVGVIGSCGRMWFNSMICECCLKLFYSLWCHYAFQKYFCWAVYFNVWKKCYLNFSFLFLSLTYTHIQWNVCSTYDNSRHLKSSPVKHLYQKFYVVSSINPFNYWPVVRLSIIVWLLIIFHLFTCQFILITTW